MPIPLIVQGVTEGVSSIPIAWTILKLTPWVLVIAVLKFYFGGARNSSERVMHSKVVMITVRFPLPPVSPNLPQQYPLLPQRESQKN